MNREIIRNWNDKVAKTDTVYILGDVFPCAGGDADIIIELTKRLNGNKILVAGNHDEEFLSVIEKSEIFDAVKHIAIVRDLGKEIMLCHYPLMSWRNDDFGSIHLYGHIHNKNLPEVQNYYTNKKAFNVGLDVRGFVPITLNEILGEKDAYIN
jgi:calcineurin-like phosphoesterase family protein